MNPLEQVLTKYGLVYEDEKGRRILNEKIKEGVQKQCIREKRGIHKLAGYRYEVFKGELFQMYRGFTINNIQSFIKATGAEKAFERNPKWILEMLFLERYEDFRVEKLLVNVKGYEPIKKATIEAIKRKDASLEEQLKAYELEAIFNPADAYQKIDNAVLKMVANAEADLMEVFGPKSIEITKEIMDALQKTYEMEMDVERLVNPI